ncbi:hypothetical protein Tco_0987827 [Tanacetum coccineum]
MIQKLRQKGVYEESFSRHAAWIGREVNPVMHTTMFILQVKTIEDPSWSTSFKTRRTQEDIFSLEELWKTYLFDDWNDNVEVKHWNIKASDFNFLCVRRSNIILFLCDVPRLLKIIEYS